MRMNGILIVEAMPVYAYGRSNGRADACPFGSLWAMRLAEWRHAARVGSGLLSRRGASAGPTNFGETSDL